jgi:DmsE family decaheme c-type cytochrome
VPRWFSGLILVCSLTTAAAIANSAGAEQQPPPPVQKPAPPPPAAAPGYVGTDTCLTCHDGMDATLTGTQHARTLNPRTPAAQQGCESCHGPGQAHVNDEAGGHILKFKSAPADVASATCLSCHNRGGHAGWEGSVHEARKLACTTCHSVHQPKSTAHQLVAATETQLCAKCHRVQVAKTERAVAHMPVREGKMACSTCHNPHGSINNVKALRTGSSVAESCTACHTEMRGPVLWEHTPVRENCAGGVHRRPAPHPGGGLAAAPRPPP